MADGAADGVAGGVAGGVADGVADGGRHTAGVEAPGVVGWLLDGDVAVAHQTTRDLLGGDPAGLRDLQARIATEGAGAALLAARGPEGHWGRGCYEPKWTSTHYTLLELKELGLHPAHPAAAESVRLVLATGKGPDGGLDPTRALRRSDVCVNGMALGYAAYFGAPTEALASIVDFVLDQQLPADAAGAHGGGFNCRLNRARSGVRHPSAHSTVCVLEGLTEYLRQGHDHRADEAAAARELAVGFFLHHWVYRSRTTGAPMHEEFTRLHHPARWHFDVLRGLDALRDAGVAPDERLADAIELLRSRRRSDGRWAVGRAYPGLTQVPVTRAGQPDRWVTLRALRVLAAYGAG